MGIFELEPFTPGDIASYEACFGVDAPVSTVDVDGGATGSQLGEAALDIEVVAGLAPSSAITVYSGPNDGTGPIDTYARMVSDDSAKVLTTSWGQCEGSGGIDPAEQRTETALFLQAKSQGQTFMAAAGDSGSSDCYDPPDDNEALSVDDPADQPDVTGVGGTSLTNEVSTPSTETVWNDGPGVGAGGGGNLGGLCRTRVAADPRYPEPLQRPLRTVGDAAVSGGARCLGFVGSRPRGRHLLRWALAALRGHQYRGTVVGRPDRGDQPRVCLPGRVPQSRSVRRRRRIVPAVQRHLGREQRPLPSFFPFARLPGDGPLRPGLGVGDPAGGGPDGGVVGIGLGLPVGHRGESQLGPGQRWAYRGRSAAADSEPAFPLCTSVASPCRSSQHTPTSITVITPDVVSAVQLPVTVTTGGTAGGTSAVVPASEYTFVSPQVSSVVPSKGPTTGGGQVTVTGSDFSRVHVGEVRIRSGILHRVVLHVVGGPGAARPLGWGHRGRQGPEPGRHQSSGGRGPLYICPTRLLAGGLRRRGLRLRLRRLLRIDRCAHPQQAHGGHGRHPR